jgi:hypothetical protein
MFPPATGRRRRFSGKKPHGQAKIGLLPATVDDPPGRSQRLPRFRCLRSAGPGAVSRAGAFYGALSQLARILAKQRRRRSAGVDRVAVAGQHARTTPAESRSRGAIRGKSLSPARFEGELSLSGGSATTPIGFAFTDPLADAWQGPNPHPVWAQALGLAGWPVLGRRPRDRGRQRGPVEIAFKQA